MSVPENALPGGGSAKPAQNCGKTYEVMWNFIKTVLRTLTASASGC